ncbi:class I SAM-dependent methyltransferase [Rhodococcoides kyotonense]|uniref:Methyltransferase domain-containing protein n=1 Tax=Rhodococcoides kyotonense TaxID=398843 RepID=A0A239L4X4_9NOCA|nr:class I SAM-dependent methyltransferase [Rhodococcus kyotonensis]SNT25375.1 Methyltransferase domain-containing protein [Rhodococcus kyotonensis]
MGLQQLEAMVQETVTAGEPFEYGADESELNYLASLAARPGTQLICEVGFNAGFSSWAFLGASPSTVVYSFDLANYAYSAAAKAHIDELFPGRHTLIQGDSHSTIREFAQSFPDMRFDVVFVDGDHSLEGARADLADLRALATHETVVVMDDITPWLWFGEGPTQAWQEATVSGSIVHTNYYRDGEPVDVVEQPASRAWAEGRYPA